MLQSDLSFLKTLNLWCNPFEIQAVGVCAYAELVCFTLNVCVSLGKAVHNTCVCSISALHRGF